MRKVYKHSSLVVILLLSLTAMAGGHKLSYWQKSPVGTVAVSGHLYYDQTEVANVHWQEYLFWLKKVYGAGSREYQSALPDRSVWDRADSCLHLYASSYLDSPAYNYYPLVGISQAQAEAFARWRSDRVLEHILVSEHVITEPDMGPGHSRLTASTCFTIERYYAGQHKGLKPDSAHMYYPVYRLPAMSEWQAGAVYTDSLLHHRSHAYRRVFEVHACSGRGAAQAPTRPVDNIVTAEYPDDLYGNVSEWVAEKDMAAGGSWKDSAKSIVQQPVLETKGVNAWTGFRCVCEWRRWDGK